MFYCELGELTLYIYFDIHRDMDIGRVQLSP